jgi:hypothetical protein
MLARSGSEAWGVVVTEGADSFFSLSKTCVASSSSSQSMSSLPPFFFAAAGVDEDDAAPAGIATGPGRVLAGAGIGGGLLTRCVALGDCDGDATACGGWLEGCVAARFGSEPRPGGGGGLLGDDGAGCTARIEPDGGGAGRAEGGAGMLGSLPSEGEVGAGPGIPSSVFFMSAAGLLATCAPEPGGGGGAPGDPACGVKPGVPACGVRAGFRSEFFLPRPSKISRSDPPLFSSDIRVS